MVDEGVTDGMESDFSPPQIEAETGIALDGDYPVNHRLRAERLAADGLSDDPGGIIGAELIASTAERMKAEDAALEAEHPTVTAAMRKAVLENIADAEGVDLSTASNNEDRVELINAARAAVGIIPGTLEETL